MTHTWTAKWIWKKQKNHNVYNPSILAQKVFACGKVANATLRITADSYYRVQINGEWVNDGPARSWPAHFQYDVIDVAAYLRHGDNQIIVFARYFGIGDFHHVPQQAGLLCQLDITEANGRKRVVASDKTWQVTEATPWERNAPKISIQREPMEIFDHRNDKDFKFAPAQELFAATAGPWKDLTPRSTALLTRRPVALRSFMRAERLENPDFSAWWLPVAKLSNPGLIEANSHTAHACMVATLLHAPRATTLRIEGGMTFRVNGREGKNGRFKLRRGLNLLTAHQADPFGHWREKCIRLFHGDYSLRNPVEAGSENPWCFVRFPESDYHSSDLGWQTDPITAAERKAICDAIAVRMEGVKNVEVLTARFGKQLKNMPRSEMFMDDPHDDFLLHTVAGPADDLVAAPAALMYDNAERTLIRPSRDGRDLQLVYDLGEQVCGYYEFDLTTPAGTVIDIFGVEYIRPDGVIQHSEGNRNGLRYIATEGRNTFVSTIRRSQRYLFVSLRQMTGPVSFRKLGLIEATYPVHYQANFSCSDTRLDKIWEISERTLKLCMEDTFTDCPLYEQTLWVGDSRNEAMFAYTTFGAQDIARNCLTLTGQSLERFYITGCQVPSTWDCLLPAWSFMWGMAVWEYYFFSGDKAYLKRSWVWVMKNLKGAAAHSDKRGLYCDHQWNMFDWGGIVDQSHMTLHNSLFIVGAINTALKSAEVIKAPAADRAWLLNYRRTIVRGINSLWDSKKNAYPDAYDSKDQPVDHSCQHTSFLSLLYDVADARIRPHAMRNMLTPPKNMGRVSSPFAIMFYFEAMEKCGFRKEIVEAIYKSYLPMLEVGATTVWEVFPDSPAKPAGFPTRSHCHAWSSAPLYFLPRVVLGIQQTEVAGAAYEISPLPCGLEWAKGQVVTAKGLLRVEWKRSDRILTITVKAPEGVRWKFVSNNQLRKFKITVNG